MSRKLTLVLCLLLLPAHLLAAADQPRPEAVKELSGMAIVGNDEAPKSLYIVPWKSAEIAAESGLSYMASAGDVPVDRDVFIRQLDFYDISTADKTRRDK